MVCRLIGEQLRDPSCAEPPASLWKATTRLHPEARIDQAILIEEVVQAFMLVVDVVREWIEERHIEVSFQEYSYFVQAVTSLVCRRARRSSTRL